MNKEKLTQIAKTIFQVVIYAILIIFAVIFIFSKMNGKPLFLFGKTTMWVITESMSPTIPSRTYILVEEVTADEVNEGDIIAFYSTDPAIEGRINTHRVIKKEGNVFVTKGDNNPATDGSYSAKAENIVGRYVRSLPIMTFFGRIILSDIGFLVVAFLFLAVTAFCYMPDLKKAVQKKEKECEEEKQREIDRLIREEIQKLAEADKTTKETENEKKE